LVDNGLGIRQIGAGIADAVAPNNRSADIQSQVNEGRLRDRPLMDTGAGVVGNMLQNAALAAVAPTQSATNSLLRYAAPAAVGSVLGAIQPVADGESRTANALVGGVGGGLGAGAARGVGAVASGPRAVSPEVNALARRADELGIPIRADQIIDSKPLNAISAGLENLPLSGAAANKSEQLRKLSRATAKTIGEDTDNIAQALPRAQERLGAQFDRVLSKTAVKADNTLQNDLGTILQNADIELTGPQYEVINKQVNNILNKIQTGDVIDAQAAYNIKKGLDRLSKNGDSSIAAYARDTRDALLDALNRSLGPEEAKGFAQTRQQWGNMRQLEKLVPAGADVDISAARLAQAKNKFTDPKLKELSDIAGQFLKQRVGDSGTQPRMMLTGPVNTGIAMGLGATVGRGTNAVLQSQGLRNYLSNGSNSLRAAVPYTNALLPGAGEAALLAGYEQAQAK
jgi:hypothetical protein